MQPVERQDTESVGRCLESMLRRRPEPPKTGNVWFDIEELAQMGSITRDQIVELGKENPAYELSADGTMIRARPDVPMEIEYDVIVEPPETLYHRTTPEGFESILRSGSAQKIGRSRVHLLVKENEMTEPPMLLRVHSGRMHRAGMKFQTTEEGAYVTDRVPLRYMDRIADIPVTHRMHSDTVSIEDIVSGRFCTMVRLFDDKRRMMRVGDTIVFTCEDRCVRVTVVGLERFDTLESLKTVSDYRLEEDMDEIRVKELGLLCIRFKLTETG